MYLILLLHSSALLTESLIQTAAVLTVVFLRRLNGDLFTQEDQKSSEKMLCVYCIIPFPSMRPVMLVRFGVPLIMTLQLISFVP